MTTKKPCQTKDEINESQTTVVNKFVGSKGWLWFWILMFFPIAIAYYFIKRAPRRIIIEDEVRR